jgi:hypothetical protein
LRRAFAAAVGLLRSGDWRRVAELPVGAVLRAAGVDLAAALDDLQDDTGEAFDLGELSSWSAFRLCGLGALADPRGAQGRATALGSH